MTITQHPIIWISLGIVAALAIAAIILSVKKNKDGEGTCNCTEKACTCTGKQGPKGDTDPKVLAASVTSILKTMGISQKNGIIYVQGGIVSEGNIITSEGISASHITANSIDGGTLRASGTPPGSGNVEARGFVTGEKCKSDFCGKK